jgi:hypothetical protein
MQLAAAPGSAAAANNQQGFVGGAPGASAFQQGMYSQQQQQQPGSAGGLMAAVAAVQANQSLLPPLQQPHPHQDLTARLAGASSPGEVLAVAGERGMGLFTEHLVMCLYK